MKLPKKDCQFNSSEQGSFLVYILVGLAVLGLIIAGIYFYFKPSLNLPKQITNPQKTNINTDFNVLIVGWDGAQWDTFNACYRKVEPACAAGLPNIKELSGGGKRIFFNIVGNGETETFPGWPQLLTGYNSGYTKIIDKKTYQPVPKGGTLLEKLKKV